MKKCNVCNEEKDLGGFYKEAQNPDGVSHRCKECKNKSTAEWRNRNKKEWNAYMRKHRAEHPLSEKAKRQQRNRLLKVRYGIDNDEYEAMLERQHLACALCYKHKTVYNRNFSIDHDHITGKVRALLCGGCNAAIAILDDPIKLAKAQAYLAKYK
jgi:hypothetical protein